MSFLAGNRLRLVFVGLILTSVLSYAQKVQTVSGTYTFYAPTSMSVEEAKHTALEKARIQAISDTFGTTVSQANSTLVYNSNGETDFQFHSVGSTEIKGEWIETIGKPEFAIEYTDNQLVVKCTVKGKARSIEQPEIDITAKILKNGTELKYEAYDFNDGDDIYVFFESSHDGSISIFLRQNESVYRLLPYQQEKSSGISVEKNTPYIFFSKKHSNDNKADEYTLYADNALDIAEVVILFTLKTPSLPSSQQGAPDEPLSTDRYTFDRWLTKKMSKDIYLKVIVLPISIRNPADSLSLNH